MKQSDFNLTADHTWYLSGALPAFILADEKALCGSCSYEAGLRLMNSPPSYSFNVRIL